MAAFEDARQGDWLKVIARTGPVAIAHSPAASDMQLDHFLSMCDDTGLFQHAVHSVPDRAHGYCVDDNARALLLACALNNPGETASVRSFDGPLCRVRAACVESRHQTVSQFHGLQSKLARRPRLRRQPWANIMGAGRVRAQGCKPVATPMGCRPVCRGIACRREPLVRPAHWPSPCWVWTVIAPLFPMMRAPGKSGIRLPTG